MFALRREEPSLPQSPHFSPRRRLGLRAREIAISATLDAAPIIVKAAQSSPVMPVPHLTINVPRRITDQGRKCRARKLRLIRWSCEWNSLRTKVQRLPERLDSAT